MAWSSKVHFKDADGFVVEEGGYISGPVLGTTAYNASDVLTGTTLPNHGTVVLTQDSSSDARLFSVKAPVEGCVLNIIVGTSQTTGNQRQINLGSGVGVLYAGTTSMQYISVSTDSVSTATYKAISLVGLSTALWGVLSAVPSSTAWTFAAATS